MTKSLGVLLMCAISMLILDSERLGAHTSAQQPTTNASPSTNTQVPSNASDVDIFTASAEGNLQAIKHHIAAGTDLDAIEPAGGGTPLIETTVTGQTEAAKLLIENGASLSATNDDGSTALHTAAFFGHPDTVTLLLEYGAEVNAKNAAGGTPLDNVADEWTDELQGVYRMIAGMFQLDLDFDRIQTARPVVADILRKNGGETSR